jgi:hypothetical protein
VSDSVREPLRFSPGVELRLGIVRELRGRGLSAVGSCYEAVAIEDVTVDTSVCVCVIMNCKV